MGRFWATSFFFAARSDKNLESVCRALQQHYGLPAFEFDVEDTEEYAWSSGHGIGFNVTRTADYQTIRTWMETAPDGVNYQIILNNLDAPETIVEDTQPVLARILGTPVTHYHTK